MAGSGTDAARRPGGGDEEPESALTRARGDLGLPRGRRAPDVGSRQQRFHFREEAESLLIPRTPGKLLRLYPSLPHGQAGMRAGRGGSGRKLRGSSQSFAGAPETGSFP